MARAVGGWLEGPGGAVPGGAPPGVRLGLPESGPGSVAGTGARLGAYVVDAVVANLLVGLPYLVGARYDPGVRGLAVLATFLVVEWLFDSVYGQTLGKRMLGLRVVAVRGAHPRWTWLLLRTLLLGLLIPAVITDRDRRGLHDKAAGTVVVRDPMLAVQPARPAQAAPVVAQGAPASAGRSSGSARTPGRRSSSGRKPARKRR